MLYLKDMGNDGFEIDSKEPDILKSSKGKRTLKIS